MKIVCVCNICEESIILKSFGEVINNNDILSFHIDDCLLADTLFDLLNHLDTYTVPAAHLKSSTPVKPSTHSSYPSLPLQSPSRRSSLRLSIPHPSSLRPSSLHPSTSILSCSGSDSTSPIACDYCSFSSAEFWS